MEGYRESVWSNNQIDMKSHVDMDRPCTSLGVQGLRNLLSGEGGASGKRKEEAVCD